MEQPIVATNEDRARSITMEDKLVNLFESQFFWCKVQKERDDDPANWLGRWAGLLVRQGGTTNNLLVLLRPPAFTTNRVNKQPTSLSIGNNQFWKKELRVH